MRLKRRAKGRAAKKPEIPKESTTSGTEAELAEESTASSTEADTPEEPILLEAEAVTAPEEAPSTEAGTDQDAVEPAANVPLEQHQRLLAEFDNFRKRMERNHQRAALWARADLLKALLPSLDDLDRARQAQKTEDNDASSEGMLIILDRLAEVLKREGLTEIEAAPGVVFDPEKHEAVLTVPSAEVSEGCVAQVLEKGYRLGEQLLRPARVGVARVPDDEPAA